MKNYIKLDGGLHISPEKETDVMPKKDVEDMNRREQGMLPLEFQTNHTQMRYVDWSFDNIRRCREYTRFQHLQYDQRFLPERLMYLGADLAAAHFIVHRQGARYDNLPVRKVPGLFLEAIDASKTALMFEGFDNLYDLEFLRMLSLAHCERADDWMLSRVGAMFESLEMSRWVKDIAKSALLLEEAIPDLRIIGLDFDHALHKLAEEHELLRNNRVLIDAKGNAFVEDDNGRCFYVHGSVNERPAVCSDDKPLMTSTIRREIPAMSDAIFEELDELSKGKLRHYLLGSPSGYSWSEQVETILSFEHWWREFERISVDTKMLPKHKRMPMLEYAEQSRLGKHAHKGIEEHPKVIDVSR
uniref:Uncharacterized protein n=1 Tax=Ditylenchus dipsaci TaxID=166011 RepID=A0A915CQ70_9BILA